MKRSRGKELKQEMNLTNMIDIVFAILIVFIISAPLMSQGVKVDLPKAEAPTMEQEKLLKVSITQNEELYIADMMVDFASFNNVFKSLWNGEMAVVINADESVNYGLVMKVVTQVRGDQARIPDDESQGKTGEVGERRKKHPILLVAR